MNIHEYQAKELYRTYGIPVPKGIACMSPAEATAAAKKLIDETGSEVVVVKAQIHAGGRGKAGGVKVVKGVDAATAAANEIFGKTLITHQTGPEGKVVQRLLVEQGLAIKSELYLALVVDRESRRIAIMASTEGGMDIEEVAANTPRRFTPLRSTLPSGSKATRFGSLRSGSASPSRSKRTSASCSEGSPSSSRRKTARSPRSTRSSSRRTSKSSRSTQR